jgi:hypothetical protein
VPSDSLGELASLRSAPLGGASAPTAEAATTRGVGVVEAATSPAGVASSPRQSGTATARAPEQQQQQQQQEGEDGGGGGGGGGDDDSFISVAALELEESLNNSACSMVSPAAAASPTQPASQRDAAVVSAPSPFAPKAVNQPPIAAGAPLQPTKVVPYDPTLLNPRWGQAIANTEAKAAPSTSGGGGAAGFPRLPPGVYTRPSLPELRAMPAAAQRQVSELVLGREGYGEIEFEGVTDVSALELRARDLIWEGEPGRCTG